MRKCVLFLLMFVSPIVLAQDWRAGLSLSQGINYAFIRKGDQQSMVGHSMGFEFFVRRHRSLSDIFFEPGVRVGLNTLRARATEQIHVNLHQQAIGLSVRGGLMVGKSTYIKVGVLAETVGYALVETVTAAGFALGHSGFSEHLYARQFMSGMIFGFGGAPGESRIVELFVECHQYLTTPLLEPFTLDALGASQPPVFNSRALTTVFIGGITFKFVKPRKRVEE